MNLGRPPHIHPPPVLEWHTFGKLFLVLLALWSLFLALCDALLLKEYIPVGKSAGYHVDTVTSTYAAW
jgi:hypothetical protein